MDKGVEFVLNNFEKTLNLINNNPQYNNLKPKVITEYNRVKNIKYTGNMYEYFLKYKGGNHKYAKDFEFLKNYNILPNELIADYLKRNYKKELNHYEGIPDLIIGKIYNNFEIANTFQCSNMGGMRRSKKTNTLVLIAKHNNKLYDDKWDNNGIFNYTGMGTKGDQELNFGQNITLAQSKTNKVKIHLFESYKANEYSYTGEVELAGDIYTKEEYDINGNLRKVLKFPLKKLQELDETAIYKQDNNFNIIKNKITDLDNTYIRPDSTKKLTFVDGKINIRKYNESTDRKKQNRSKKPDYIAEQIIKTKQGIINERKVYEMELDILDSMNAQKQKELMKNFYENKKDNESYDILSFELNKKGKFTEKYIEVKSTKAGESTPFNLTANELQFAIDNKDHYYLYRIYNSDSNNPYYKIISGKELLSEYTRIPTEYIIYGREDKK